MVRQSFCNLFFSDTRFFESFAVVNHLVQYGESWLGDERPGRKGALIAEIRVGALRGEVLWASCREKLQSSPAAPRE